MTQSLSPVDTAIRAFGGVTAVADAMDLHPSSPYAWKRASKWREAGDFPSVAVARKLLLHARANGIPLTAEHLIFGCDAEELDALLAASRADIAAE